MKRERKKEGCCVITFELSSMTSVFFDPSFYTFQAPLVPPPSGDIELGDNNANQLGSTRSGNTEPPQQQLTRLRDHVLFLHQCIVLGWISLCLYFLFVLMCWAQFRRGDEAIWRNIFPPFVMVQVVAVIDEVRAKIIHAMASYILPWILVIHSLILVKEQDTLTRSRGATRVGSVE